MSAWDRYRIRITGKNWLNHCNSPFAQTVVYSEDKRWLFQESEWWKKHGNRIDAVEEMINGTWQAIADPLADFSSSQELELIARNRGSR